MYIPSHYKVKDLNEIHDFLCKYSFALLITAKGNYPVGTHLPFIIKRSGDEFTLISHMAKGNAQWRDFNDREVLIVFYGPDAYISPEYYESRINVPTWNYASVHLYGTARIMNDEIFKYSAVEELINFHEKDYLNQWNDLPHDYKNKLLKGIVAFEIKVTRIEAKYKLSQNKSEKDRENIMNSLIADKDGIRNELGVLMKKFYENNK